jgi:MurNAc alpha-1-phosphate uridylyltransferase
MVRLWDAAQEAGRLWGVVHDGAWFHVGTPTALETASRLLDPHFVRWVEP